MLADDECVIAGFAGRQQFMVDHSCFALGRHLDHEFLLVVMLIVVDRQVLTVKVEKTVRKFIAGECPQEEV